MRSQHGSRWSIPLVDQTHFPLATLISVACQRATTQAIRILALAGRVSAERARDHGIPEIGGVL